MVDWKVYWSTIWGDEKKQERFLYGQNLKERGKERKNLKVYTFEENIDHGEISSDKKWGKRRNGESGISTFPRGKKRDNEEESSGNDRLPPLGNPLVAMAFGSHGVMWKDGDLARALKHRKCYRLMVTMRQFCELNSKDYMLWKPSMCFKTKTKMATFYNLSPTHSLLILFTITSHNLGKLQRHLSREKPACQYNFAPNIWASLFFIC